RRKSIPKPCRNRAPEAASSRRFIDHAGVKNPFAPAWPWRHPHFQSIVPSLLPHWRLRRRARPMLAASRELILDCGAGVRLQAWHARPAGESRGSAILLHGWEGSASSYYVVALAAQLFAAGVEV